MENWNWTKILLFLSFIIFLGSLLLRQESAITQDLGRHLRLGEMIVQGGEARKCALYSNCLTYTYPDYPFINHHWGSEVIFYLVHKLAGFSGIIILKTVILGLAFIVTALHSAPRGPSSLKRTVLYAIAVAITFLSIQMMADRLTTRPEIFGYLFFSLLFWLLNSSFPKRHFSLFLVSCSLLILMWANLHISFIFGLILIYLWSLSELIKKGPALRRKAGPYQAIDVPSVPTILIISTISTIVTLLNPSGLRGALIPLSILKDYGYTIVENMTPFFLSAFKPQPEYWIYSIFLVIITILIIISPKKPSFFSISTFYLFSVFPLIAVRHLPFFALVVPIILTPLISVKFRKLHKGEKFTKLPILIASGLLIAALNNPVLFAYGKLPPANLSADSRHDPAIEFVKQNNLQGKMWNNYDIGSFLEWAIPQHPTFVDGRPEAFPVGFFRQTYIPMQENKEIWDRVVADYDIQWVFATLTDSTPWFIKWWKMIQNHEDWRIVYIDNYSAVLVRINGNNNFIEPQGKAKLLMISNQD